MKEYDLIAIGDMATDAFIRMEEPGAHCHMDRQNLELCMYYGEKVPYQFVEVVTSVGNSPNASVCASRLGLKCALISNIGDDRYGEDCLKNLTKEKVDIDFVSKQNGKESNYHYVLWFEDDRTILVKHHAYEYKLPNFEEPKAIYLSSIGENTENYHEEIANYLENHPNVKLIFQPGTFQIKLGTEKLKRIYKRTDFFAVNKREAQKVLKNKEEDFKKLIDDLHKLGPKMVLITDGVKGAYFSDGSKKLFMPIYPDEKPPYERTGAGDSYTSTLACSILLFQKSPEEGLQLAGINANSVIQFIGAQKGLLNKEKIEEKLKTAKENYVAKEI